GPGVTAHDFFHDCLLRSPARRERSLLSSGQGSPASSSVWSDGASSTALSPGSRQPSAESGGNVPLPPDARSSLAQRTGHRRPGGGASNGSGAGLKCSSLPRFTTSRRSSPFGPK